MAWSAKSLPQAPQMAAARLSSTTTHHLGSSFLSPPSTTALLHKKAAVALGRRRRGYRVAPAMAAAVSNDRMLVFVPPHPLIKHWVSVLRNEETPSAVFKNAMGELGRLLIYEASRDWMPTISGEILSPLGVASVEFIDPREPIMLVPILRAGLSLVEHAPSILPATKTYHLGFRRDESTLLPSLYLNNLPEKFPEGARVLLVDPMLATGGTIVAAVDLVKDRGVQNRQIKIISAVVAPPALTKLSEKFPGVHVYTGIIDPEVNEKGSTVLTRFFISFHLISTDEMTCGDYQVYNSWAGRCRRSLLWDVKILDPVPLTAVRSRDCGS